MAINGKSEPTTVKELVDNGYEVKFLADKAVFKPATGSTPITTSSTGELLKSAVPADTEFSYKVEVLKDGEVVATSELVNVKSENFANIITEITNFDITLSNSVVLNSTTLVTGETATIGNLEGTNKAGTEEVNISNATFTSSNPAVATINAAGTIKALTTGTTTITVKSGEATKEITLTVSSDARVATSATANVEDVKIVNGTTKDVTVTVLDQYGDSFKSKEVIPAAGLTLQTDEETPKTVATVAASQKVTDAEGKATFTISAHSTNSGTTTFVLKQGNDTLISLPITVAATGQVETRKLELTDSSKDLTLDVNPIKSDNSVTLAFNQYNSEGYLIGTEKSIDDEAGKTYTVKSSDDSIVSVEVNSSTGVITVTANKAGQADVEIYKGAIFQEKVTVTVKDTRPSLSSVAFKDLTIESDDEVTLEEILDNVKISSTDAVSYDVNNGSVVAYVETDAENNLGFDDADIKLGTISQSTVGALDATFAHDGGETYTLADITLTTESTTSLTGETAQLVLYVVKAGETNALVSKTVGVNVAPTFAEQATAWTSKTVEDLNFLVKGYSAPQTVATLAEVNSKFNADAAEIVDTLNTVDNLELTDEEKTQLATSLATVQFNTNALQIVDGKLKIVGKLLTAEQFAALKDEKLGGDATQPYNITVLIGSDKAQKAIKIAINPDGTANFVTISES